MTGADQLASALPATANADCRAGEAAGCGGESFAAVAETHSAVVFFAGDRAYKLKKPAPGQGTWSVFTEHLIKP